MCQRSPVQGSDQGYGVLPDRIRAAPLSENLLLKMLSPVWMWKASTRHFAGPLPTILADAHESHETLFTECVQDRGSASAGACHAPALRDRAPAAWIYAGWRRATSDADVCHEPTSTVDVLTSASAVSMPTKRQQVNLRSVLDSVRMLHVSFAMSARLRRIVPVQSHQACHALKLL